MDNEINDDHGHTFAKFWLCNFGGQHDLDLINMLLLDNKSKVNLLCNKRIIIRVWTKYDYMTVKRYGGTINTNHNFYVKGYGEVWFDERAITNILVLKNVKRKFRVNYDSNNDGLFTIQNTSGKYVPFNMHKGGIYYHDTKNRHVTLVKNVSDNKAG